MREHTEIIRPPRALWVPFELGRPLGGPGDAALQTRVLTAALELLGRLDGPVLADYPEDAPAPQPAGSEDGADGGILACPVPRRDAGGPPPGPRELLAAEIAFLRPWYAIALRERGRTTVGVSGLEPEAAASLLADWIEGGDGAGIPADLLKLAIDDLRAYCLEAGGAQPGGAGDGARLERWYWWETAVGRALREAQPQALASADAALRFMAKVLMIPTAQRAAAP